ncbi:hypothetical protein NDU88_005274 [Pleurodeles waltl]|uniref:Uncharacterized protein n=1 Tax=Pleurodeles waltl TaxID=8319 RepID=A0AAV7ULE6_PLEWA|nr:hypothetical protein NDU88_005274 [Pleurodeles waltl]
MWPDWAGISSEAGKALGTQRDLGPIVARGSADSVWASAARIAWRPEDTARVQPSSTTSSLGHHFILRSSPPPPPRPGSSKLIGVRAQRGHTCQAPSLGISDSSVYSTINPEVRGALAGIGYSGTLTARS